MSSHGALCFLLLVAMTNVSGNRWRHPANEVSGDEYSYVDDHHREDGIFFSEKDLYRLKKIIPKLPIKGSPLEGIFNMVLHSKGKINSNMEEILLKEEEDFMEKLKNDESLRSKLSRKTQHMPPRNEDVDDNIDVGEIPDIEDRNQTQGWEGCLRDYNMVMLPETQAVYHMSVLKLNDEFGLPILEVPEVPEANPVARPIIDAIAKRPPGLLQGALQWVGSIEQCEDTGVRYHWNITGSTPEVRHFRGKYARINVPLVTDAIPTIMPPGVGICAPDTCSDDDIVRYVITENEFMIRYLLGGLAQRNITVIYTGQKINFATDPAAKGVVAYLIIMIVILIVATCYDGWGRHRVIRDKIQYNIGGEKKHDLTPSDVRMADSFLFGSPTVGERFEAGFAGFSLYSNIRHVYTIEMPRDHIGVLDGLKAVTYLWTIKSLTYVYGVVYFETYTQLNLFDALLRYLDEWSTMSIIAVPYAASSFFFVSGFVCVHMYYKAFKRNNEKFSFWFFIRYFLHRYWSLMPSIMGILVVYTWYYRYLGDGPLTSPDVSDAEKCKKTWWLAGLMFHNLFKMDTQCFAWSWYFGCLWQLSIVSAVVLIPLVLLPALGYVMLVLMYIAHIVVFAIWQQKSFDGEGLSWFTDILQTPWCHAGPYVIGMMFAMIINGANRKAKWHWCPILVLWLCSIAGILTVVYAPWDQLKSPDREWTREGQIAFDVLAPQLLALSLGWITFACWKGYGGVVNSFLSWKFFHWMSKMMIALTVFHAPVMQIYFMGLRKAFYLHENHISLVFHGHLLSIFIYANLVALFFTYPFSRGMTNAVRAKTRLELFLWGRHPAVLSGLTGDPDVDKPHLEELYTKEQREGRHSTDKRFITGDKVDIIRSYQPYKSPSVTGASLRAEPHSRDQPASQDVTAF